jgi:chromate reductase, NAD(P)H dehydrogenase (quinone)
MTTIIGLSGSLRKGSYNTALLHAAAAMMPEGVAITVKTIHGIPLFNQDVESAEGIPEVVSTLKESIAAADGLLLSTPEYNNAIDWLSRPPADIKRVFGGKPVALMGATLGGFGTVLGQIAWLPPLRTLGTNPWFGGRLVVPDADEVFDSSGQLINAPVKEQLQKFVDGFIKFVQS